jgi:hypothetical protein
MAKLIIASREVGIECWAKTTQILNPATLKRPAIGGAHHCDLVQKFGLDRTGINEVVGIFADYEVTEPEGERAS